MLFDQKALDAAVKASIPEAVAGDNAIVLDVDAAGAKVAVLVEKGEHWTVKGVYAHEWSGDNSYAGQVVFRWKK